MPNPQSDTSANRLMSIDAYRGFVMLAMAASGFGFSVLAKPENMQKIAESGVPIPTWLLRMLAYQFDHVAWTGCGFWDLIQPSFMFLVGVAVPFSYSRRASEGQSPTAQFGHVLWRSFVLVALGVFLSSNGSPQTNFTFVNVLSQIGLGYPVLYLLRDRSLRAQFAATAIILVGYWAWFANYSIPPAQFADVQAAITERHPKLLKPHAQPELEWTQFRGFGAHWNKHVNAAADVDRKLLNQLPREGEPFRGQKFWVNEGGYQTLNFIPSLATMLLGLMAGVVLRSTQADGAKVSWLLKAGVICFGVSMALDTSIWPVAIPNCDWHLAPIVKRIWSPGWAVFSSGWTFWMLAAFYWVIDIRKWRAWSWPLMIVGMNSIAMYVMAQLMKPWIGSSLKTHLTTLDALLGWKSGITETLFGDNPFATPLGHAARLLGLWLSCVWLYRRKIFVRVGAVAASKTGV
ncbi:MAG: acyltransferase family protein, partial [Planctomycetaceae bacterium]